MRRPVSFRALALAAALLFLAVATVAVFIPYLTRERENVAGVPVPVPFGVEENIRLRPGAEVCLADVAMDPDTQIAEFTAVSGRRVGPPLRVSAAGPGYRASGVSAGYSGREMVRVRLEPPTRSLFATFCVANGGRRKVDLVGTHEARTVSRPVASVNGREVAPDLSLRFLSEDSGSVLARMGSLIDRAAAFHPPVFEAPVLWLLLALVVLVLPAAAIYAVVSGFRAGD
jgi:hypothetical protein